MSFASILARATASVLARSGEDALLRGIATQEKVHIAQDVDMIDAQGTPVVVKFIATISAAELPERDDTLVVQSGPLAGTYILETPVDDSGYSSRWILRKTA